MSYVINFRLGDAISLRDLAADNNGGAVNLPDVFRHEPGVYMILNRSLPEENRYMGISTNIRRRFLSRIASIFELGLNREQLESVYAFTGTVSYGEADSNRFILANNYRYPFIQLGDNSLDFEHLFIKVTQLLFGGTTTNTQKTDSFYNFTGDTLVVNISWGLGERADLRSYTLGEAEFIE